MSLSILQSIHPKYCELIASGKKTIEVRKTKPRIPTPFKVYIYETKDKCYQNLGFADFKDDDYWFCFIHKIGKVIGEYVCDEIIPISMKYAYPNCVTDFKEVPYTGLSDEQITAYLGNGKQGYGWHISNLKIYDQSKELSEFRKPCIYKELRFHCDLCEWGEEEIIEIPPNDCGYDGQAHRYVCTNVLTRAPQSWCYVEGIE